MINALLTTLIALILAYVLSEIFRHFNFPRVIGQILGGIILGVPIIKSVLITNEIMSILSFLANIGVILLFFFVGLEISFKQFKKNFKETSLIAFFNTSIPLIAGFLVGKFLFDLNNIVSLILGISVSVSSQSISLDILEEKKLLKSRIGNLILSTGTVDDVFELLLISSILIVFHSSLAGQLSFQKLIIDIIVFSLMVTLFKLLLVPLALKLFQKDKSQTTLFMGALILVLLIAYLSELLGIGSLIGALIAGMLVRQTLLTGDDRKPWRKNEISHSIHIISFGFLIPIFFVNVGLNINIGTLPSNLFLLLILILIDIIGTLAGTVIGVLISKGTLSEGLIVGWGVIPKGDTELVIATLALNTGLISSDIFTVIILVALFSTFLAPIAFNQLIKKHSKIAKGIQNQRKF